MTHRRIVAIVFPDLLCELIRQRHPTWQGRRSEPPFGVLLAEGEKTDEENHLKERVAPAPTSILAAVNEAARHYGVCTGQTLAEAHAFVTRLVSFEITRTEVAERLGQIAEMAMSLGPTVSVGAPDTVWVDITGASHLSGGEERLALEFAARVGALGHKVRIAVANGPELARAFARWGKLSSARVRILGDSDAAVDELSVKALPAPEDVVDWFIRLGVRTFGDLRRLPREAVGPRLGATAGRLMDLAAGRDESPLTAYVPPAMPREETTWEEPVTGSEPLLFVLRGLTSRLSARLEGRGEAVQALSLVLMHDSAISRLEGTPRTSTLSFEFAAPLHRQEEIYRVIASRLTRHKLSAPSIGLGIETKAITRALALQLPLSRHAAGLGGDAQQGPETLPVLLAELAADLGKDKMGVLERVSSHRPEKKGRLANISLERKHPRDRKGPSEDDLPTRLLGRPIPFDAPLRKGSTVSVDHRLYTVEKLTFDRRLEAVEWWTKEPVSRDYLRLWLSGPTGGLELLVYKDRANGTRWIQGVWD